MKPSIAIGSRRMRPTAPVIAAVVSAPAVAPRYTPCVQLKDSIASGTVVERRPPKRIAEIGTPCGSLAYRESAGLLSIGAVKRLFGGAAGSLEPRFPGLPRQPMTTGAGPSIPSHQL